MHIVRLSARDLLNQELWGQGPVPSRGFPCSLQFENPALYPEDPLEALSCLTESDQKSALDPRWDLKLQPQVAYSPWLSGLEWLPLL